jgi:5-formyltetrahydrofolate cyclo-ligase
MVEDANLIDSPDTARAKRELRSIMRSKRLALSATQRMHAAEAVADHLQTIPAFAEPGYIAGYWAVAGELPLHVLQMRLNSGLVWCLPCIQANGGLGFAPWRPGDDLVSNRYGIPEPDLAPESQLPADAMSVILLPLLGFTRSGQRLGMGGGYYDRSLSFRQQVPAPPLLVGVGYACQELSDLPPDHWDVRVDMVVTELGLISCQEPG